MMHDQRQKALGLPTSVRPQPYTLDPEPYTLNPKPKNQKTDSNSNGNQRRWVSLPPYALNPGTLDPDPQTLNLNPQP